MTTDKSMDYRIWKYELEITADMQVIEMPMCSTILSVANQDGKLCLWAMGDTARAKEERRIEIIGTGNPINHRLIERKFIGTVLVGTFVWHVFECVGIYCEGSS